MSFLNGKIAEKIVVPVKCEKEQGTAFFISPSQLMTARHVVRAHFDSTIAPAPIYITVAGKAILCRGEEIGDANNPIDLARLTIMPEANYQSADVLELLKDPFIPDLSLKVYGYPQEVAMGQNLVDLKVRNRLELEGQVWNDRGLVRDDLLKLTLYDGLSGGPVLNELGKVIGVVVLQVNETLSYLSINKASLQLDSKGIVYSTNWEMEDTTTLGQGRSHKICEDAVASIHDRYMPELHQQNEELESVLSDFADKKAADESEYKATTLADYIAHLPPDVHVMIQRRLKYGHDINVDTLSDNCFDLLARCHDYIKGHPFRQKLHWAMEHRLTELNSNLNVEDFKRLKFKEVKSLCLKGKAGAGKTHSLCEFALKNQDAANIYLFFGTDFNQHESAINHVRKTVCEELSFEDFNLQLQAKDRYALIIIDALNEGLGCPYWNYHLGALRNELKKYNHFRLAISVRTPFDKELTDLSEANNWRVCEIDGFVNKDRAIDAYFRYYDVDRQYRESNIDAFKNPLFLKMFCETFHTMPPEERRNANKRSLYKRYVAGRNQQVSEQMDEDSDLNVADSYLMKLANYCVFYNHFNPLLRSKAREYAKRMAPGRLWSKDLLHACLSANLLLEDRSQDGGSAVMFEYENLGDYYKAEQLLHSKMDVDGVLNWLMEELKFLKRNPQVPAQKFDATVKALFDCWLHEGMDVTSRKNIQREGPFYELFYENLIESNIKGQQLVQTLLKLDSDHVNPLRLIGKFEEVTLEEAMTIHQKLLGYPTIGSRDLIWTRYANQMYEMYGDEFLMDVPDDINVHSAITDDERKYLVCIVWMLSSSHPRFRAKLIRRTRSILLIHTSLIIWVLELFEKVNDPYVQAGLYCAICGIALPSRDKRMVSEIADYIYHHCYEHEESVPQDLLVRQWTLKIIERAYYLDNTCDYWMRIKTPFKAREIDTTQLPPYDDVKRNRAYFGLHQGSMMMQDSIFGFEDFNRYIIGTNNRNVSNDYFLPDEDEGYVGVPLANMMAEMAYYITQEFGWNDKLGAIDDGKFSPNRAHNDQERIGKKFQWLAWYRVNARLMDACYVSREQYYYSDTAKEGDLTEHPYPWNSSDMSRFDPTLDVGQRYDAENWLKGIESTSVNGAEVEDWINKNEYLPSFRYKASAEDRDEYVMLIGYDTSKSEVGQDTFLFSSACFVHREDANAFAEWAKEQNFYGRWMPERRGMTEFLWNDYPWADVYKSTLEERETWEQPSDCPVKLMLSYETQLQEDWEGIDDKDEFLSTVYMPCVEIMEQLNLFCSETRGVVKDASDGAVAALNTGHGANINGLFIRKDILDAYLDGNDYVMFYYVLGEKVQRSSSSHSIMKDLSAAYQYQQEGEIVVIQQMRVIEREEPEPIRANPARIAELKEKNETSGLTTREMIELAHLLRLEDEK